ncbi:MAG: hypothetical protein IKF58_11490, partial [Bacillus sp. (in: Bacteria)]|nr:hypothetical protein [Bacillus sp. (in: firmicutes)]
FLEDIEPDYDEEFDEYFYHDYNHPFIKGEFRINCMDLTLFMLEHEAFSERYKGDPREGFYLNEIRLRDPNEWWLPL